MLEVLDLVEVRRPVHAAVADAAAAVQLDGVAQPLAAVGEVPDPPVLAAVQVAGRAADVLVAVHLRVVRVVEDPLALQDLRGERLGRHGRDLGQALEGAGGRGEDAGHVVDGHRARHEALHEEPAAGRQHQPLRRPSHAVDAGDDVAAVGVHHLHQVRALGGHERVVAQPAEGHRHRQVAVVQVLARGEDLRVRAQVDLRHDGAHGAVEGERAPVAEGAAQRVVLLGGDPGADAVGRDGDGGDVVRHAPPAGLRVGAGVLGQRERRGSG